MYASPSDHPDLSFSGGPPVLVIGDTSRAIAKAAASVECAGARIGARLELEEASPRLKRQAAAAAVWIEIDGHAPRELLRQVDGDASRGRYGAIISTPSNLIDDVASCIEDPSVEILVDADDAERVAALAIAIAKVGEPSRASDVAADKSAARLRQLSEEVSRIASTLARLSTGPAALGQPAPVASAKEVPPVSAELVRSVIRARRLRARYFSEELFADPAWDMLLDLLQAEIAQLRVPVSSLCIAAAVPATTALRWLKTMVQEGLFLRRADPHDGRRVFVELAPETSLALRRYFAEVGSAAVI